MPEECLMYWFVCSHILVSDFNIAFLHRNTMEAGRIFFVRTKAFCTPTVIMCRSAFKLCITFKIHVSCHLLLKRLMDHFCPLGELSLTMKTGLMPLYFLMYFEHQWIFKQKIDRFIWTIHWFVITALWFSEEFFTKFSVQYFTDCMSVQIENKKGQKYCLKKPQCP